MKRLGIIVGGAALGAALVAPASGFAVTPVPKGFIRCAIINGKIDRINSLRPNATPAQQAFMDALLLQLQAQKTKHNC